jgi:hypothetical protein
MSLAKQDIQQLLEEEKKQLEKDYAKLNYRKLILELQKSILEYEPFFHGYDDDETKESILNFLMVNKEKCFCNNNGLNRYISAYAFIVDKEHENALELKNKYYDDHKYFLSRDYFGGKAD